MKQLNSTILSLLPIFFLAILLPAVISSKDPEVQPTGGSFDELVFTQLWGFTECLQFKAESKDRLTCRFEGKPSIWSIHGIWPTQTGTSGPNFCSKVTFDESLIATIEDELSHYWYEINEDKDGTYFWSHEWIKHGSCAKELLQMDSELKYFQTGLQLRNQYDLYSILKDGGIVPQASSDGYHLQDITAAIEKTLKVTPYIQCYLSKEGKEHVYHLLAVELCLNRSFEPVSCSSRSELSWNADRYGATVKCPKDALIIYSDNFPEAKKQEL